MGKEEQPDIGEDTDSNNSLPDISVQAIIRGVMDQDKPVDHATRRLAYRRTWLSALFDPATRNVKFHDQTGKCIDTSTITTAWEQCGSPCADQFTYSDEECVWTFESDEAKNFFTLALRYLHEKRPDDLILADVNDVFLDLVRMLEGNGSTKHLEAKIKKVTAPDAGGFEDDRGRHFRYPDGTTLRIG